MRRRQIVLASGGREYSLELRGEDGSVAVDGRIFSVRRAADGSVHVLGDRSERAWSVEVGETRWVFFDGRVFELVEPGARRGRRAGQHHGTLSAPMPATVRHIAVSVGDPVARGDTLVVLEAMKMELPIRAPGDGVVAAVNCRAGELVQPGSPLIRIEADA